MTNYERLREGMIISLRNFTFEDGSLDHAWNYGRLCIILHSDDDYDYVAAISSNDKMPDKKVYIESKDMLNYFDNRYIESTLNKYRGRSINKHIMVNMYNKEEHKKINGYINLQDIYAMPIAFRDEIGKVKEEVYKKVINKMHELYNTNTIDEISTHAKYR